MNLEKINILSQYIMNLVAVNNSGHHVSREFDEAIKAFREELGIAIENKDVAHIKKGGSGVFYYDSGDEGGNFPIKGPATVVITYEDGGIPKR